MKYIHGKIYTTRAGVELTTPILMAEGINGFSVEGRSVLEEGLTKKNEYDWDYADKDDLDVEEETVINFYLEENDGEKLIKIRIALMSLRSRIQYDNDPNVDIGRLYLEDEMVDDSLWKEKWKEYYKPKKISKKILVKPSWEEIKEEDFPKDSIESLKIIEMDPGMAFGTGTHETTSMCIQLMEEMGCKDKLVLDVGTGSGILSIAAALLEAKGVLGVDIDPTAIQVATENVKKNKIGDIVKIQEGDLTKGIAFQGDIVVANLTADLIILLSQAVPRHVTPSGIFITSGILVEQKEKVISEVSKVGFKVLKNICKGDWCALAFKK